MNKSIGIQLAIYSLLLAFLGYLTYYLAPAWGQPTLIAGFVGGMLCLVWGLRAINGNGSKTLPILTLIPILFVLLSQAVLTWGAGSQAAPNSSTAAMLITVLFALSLAMIMRIAYAGVFAPNQRAGAEPDRSAASPQTEQPTRSGSTARPDLSKTRTA